MKLEGRVPAERLAAVRSVAVRGLAPLSTRLAWGCRPAVDL